MKLKDLEKKLMQLQRGKLEELLEEAVRENENEITEFNKNQLARGEYPSGQKTPAYSPFTLKQKRQRPNELYGDGIHYSLRNTGGLFNEMTVVYMNGKIDIDSSSPSAIKLDDTLRDRGIRLSEFLGLNKDNSQEVIMILNDDIKKKLNKFLNGL